MRERYLLHGDDDLTGAGFLDEQRRPEDLVPVEDRLEGPFERAEREGPLECLGRADRVPRPEPAAWPLRLDEVQERLGVGDRPALEAGELPLHLDTVFHRDPPFGRAGLCT